MTQALIPSIGTKGIWDFDSPYKEAISATAVFECMAVRKLSDVIAAGEDAFARYYSNFGLSNSAYVADVRADVCIVSLVTGNGFWQYIPSNRIKAFPVTAGVAYSNIVLAVDIGLLPEQMDLTGLINRLRDMVEHHTSLVPEVITTVSSETTLKTTEEHQAFLDSIATLNALNKTDYTKIVELTQEAVALRAKLATAEAWIKQHSMVMP